MNNEHVAEVVSIATGPRKCGGAELVRIDFHGDEIWAAIDKDGQAFAVVKRVCEMLGIDTKTQVEKLENCPWAVTGMIPATGPDGKTYNMNGLRIEDVPMWLATIHASKVSEDRRPMLVALQKEARDVLANHFLRREQLAGITQQQIEAALDRRLLPIWKALSAYGDGAHLTDADQTRIKADHLWCRNAAMKVEGISQKKADSRLNARLRGVLLLERRWTGGVLPHEQRGGKRPRTASRGIPRDFMPTVENFYRLERDRLVALAATTGKSLIGQTTLFDLVKR